VIELLVQLVVQLVVEIIGDLLIETSLRGVANVLRNRVGRYVLGAVVGLGVGVGWGQHLSGQQSWPRLLWVSLLLGAVALVLAVGRAGAPVVVRSGWRAQFAWPWQWSADRLVGFAFINAGLAVGVVVGFAGRTAR